MGYLKYLKETWNKQGKEFSELMNSRLIAWRKEPVMVRIEKPTRIDRARSLGYKAKPGFVIVRHKMARGGKQRPDIKGGRRTKASRQWLTLDKNYQQLSEERVSKRHPNCEVLGSYFLVDDGKHIWHEVILVDRDNPNVYMNKNTAWARDTKGKAYRGITSAARKSRGLRRKGTGSEKTRPSLGANKGRH